ncbi:EAL domain-containing protein [Pseudoalteromonas piscicida]|uniref:Diguanylate phosphodiesterase n=1 Tax=Pseudoalteromonas piscicida TaxID=43662 RepID=A0A2A5JSB9_PSEO7|nr:EAL domain-containing protein [Pseudoalteromonas piscicida]PCK32364.1 diguanylate phosphodiesterase [Pseudoalteromonas piscicida]
MEKIIPTQCKCKRKLDFDITMAFQPIVDIQARAVFSYEALVRGKNGESAYEILNNVNDENQYAFDQHCRVTAIETFSQLSKTDNLNINFMPQAIYEPQACLATTIKSAKRCQFPAPQIIFEVTEQEQVVSRAFLTKIFKTYRQNGFKTAIDDFGEGYAGLSLLSGFQPDLIKLDMSLITDIATNPAKQAILKGISLTCDLLGVRLLAEGVETKSEYEYLKLSGIKLMQGYYFAKPQVESLPAVDWSKV